MSLDYIALLLAQRHVRHQFEAAAGTAGERAPLTPTAVLRWRYRLADALHQVAYRLERAGARP